MTSLLITIINHNFFLQKNSLGFQSSDSSSLDSDSSISDNENGLTFMDSENQAQFVELNDGDKNDDEQNDKTKLTNNILKENVFLLNNSTTSSKVGQQRS